MYSYELYTALVQTEQFRNVWKRITLSSNMLPWQWICFADCNINSGFCSVFTWSLYLSHFMDCSTRNTLWRHWRDCYTSIYIHKFLLNVLYCFLLCSYKPFIDFHITISWICTLMFLKFILESVTVFIRLFPDNVHVYLIMDCGLISGSNSVIPCTLML